jgi:hypothetical protein
MEKPERGRIVTIPQVGGLHHRALQTADEPLDFKLPEAGPERYGVRFSFSETAFVLEGWVRFHDSEGRFDEGDPFCLRISRTRFMPFEHCERPTLARDEFSYGFRPKESHFRMNAGRIQEI